MGNYYPEARCLTCNEQFSVSRGGGAYHFDLHCVQCGYHGTVHIQMDGCSERTTMVDACASPADIEAAAGRCLCGGHFSLEAAPGCPRCASAELDLGFPICFD